MLEIKPGLTSNFLARSMDFNTSFFFIHFIKKLSGDVLKTFKVFFNMINFPMIKVNCVLFISNGFLMKCSLLLNGYSFKNFKISCPFIVSRCRK